MRIKKSAINSILGVVFLIITTFLSFILSKSFLTYLGVEYNGINGVFTNIVSILSITELGIASSISYALFKPVYEHDYKKIAALMNFFKNIYRIIGILILFLALIITTFIPIFIKNSTLNDNYIRLVFFIFSINSSISYFFAYNRTLLFAYQENYVASIVDFIFKSMKSIIQLFLLAAYKNYILFLVVNISLTFLNNLFIHIMAHKKHPEIDINKYKADKNIKKEVFGTIKCLSIIQIMSVSINFTDNVIISSFIGIVEAGLFVNYNLVYTQINTVITTLLNGIGASLGNLFAENNIKRIKEVMYNYEYLTFFLASFCAICLLFLMQPFVANVWLDKRYLLSNSFLIIMVINMYLLINRQTINYYLRLSGNYNDAILPIIIEAVVNIIVSIALVFNYGCIGVVLGTLVSSITGYAFTMIRYNKRMENSNKSYIFRQLIFLSITFLEILTIYGIKRMISINNLFLEFIVLLLVCIIVIGIVDVLIIKNNKKLDIFNKVLNKIFHRKKITN